MYTHSDEKLVVALSSAVKHGTVYNRHNPEDSEVIAVRKQWLASLNIPFDCTVRLALDYDKTDFCQYVHVDETQKGRGMVKADGVVADALVTTVPGVALFLPVADCIPVTLYDPEHGVLMLSHLGRHSLEQQGAVASVRYLKEHYKSSPATLQVWSGPSIDAERYPIWALDGMGMKEAFFAQMDAAGVLRENIHDDPRNTADDAELYSHSEALQAKQPFGSHGMVAMLRQ